MSRIFRNCKEAINEIKRDIHEMGILVHPNTMQNKDVKDNPDYDTTEVQNYSFTIIDTSDKNTIVPNLSWCEAEFAERIDKDFQNPGKAWELRKEVWEEFLDDLGKFDYTYNDRINKLNQLQLIIVELKQNPDTRQACIMTHFPEDKIAGLVYHERIPCSMYYQFMIRRGKLDIIYNMRSSDFNTHFANDIWLACQLRDYIANEINKEVGLFMMNIGSLHIYKNYGCNHVF